MFYFIWHPFSNPFFLPSISSCFMAGMYFSSAFNCFNDVLFYVLIWWNQVINLVRPGGWDIIWWDQVINLVRPGGWDINFVK